MSRKRLMQAGIMLAGALLLVTASLKSQAPARSAQVWEYSSVSGSALTYSTTDLGITPSWVSSATICYATAQGCRREDLAKDVPSREEGAEALMMAASKLGADGWELTSSTEVMDSNSYDKRVLYFRRLKSGPK